MTHQSETYGRIAIGACAIATLIFALIEWFNPNVLLPIESWWMMMASFGVGLIGVSLLSDWRSAGLIASSMVFGISAQLAHKSPFWFQSLNLEPSSSISIALLCAIAFQVAVGMFFVFRPKILGSIIAMLAKLGWLRVAMLGGFLGISSATMMQGIGQNDLRSILKQYAYAGGFVGINLLSVIAFSISLPKESLTRWFDGLPRWLSLPGQGNAVGRLDQALPIWTASFVLLASGLLSYFAFQHTPHVEDEVVYLVQAKYLAQGMLSVPEPPSVESFEFYLMDTHNGKWFSTTFPGWPLMLALGTKFNATWLVNPLLAASSILLAHSLFKSLWNRGSSNMIILLMACSPWFLLMSASLMVHTLTITLILGAWVLLVRARQRTSAIAAFAAGCLLGYLFLTRPMEGLLIGTLTGIWALSFSLSWSSFKIVVAFGVGCILIGCGLFYFNAYLTGDPFSTPLNVYVSEIWGEGRNGYGFRENVGPPNWGGVDLYPGHNPLEAVIHLQNNFYFLNSEFLGWGIGSLWLASIFLLWGKWTRIQTYLAAIVATTLTLYSLYWFAGSFYIGPRYWFLMFVPLVVFSVAGLDTLRFRMESISPNALVSQRAYATFGMLCVCSALIFTTWLGLNKYPDMRGYHGDYIEMSHSKQFQNALVFVHAEGEPEYGSALANIDPTFKSVRPIFALDLGRDVNARLVQAFPDRSIFFVNGRNGRSDKVEIVRGPLTRNDFLLDQPETAN